MEARDTQFFHAGVNFAQRRAEQEKKAIEARSAFLAKLAQKRQQNSDWAVYDNQLAEQNERYNELLAQQQEQLDKNQELSQINEQMEQVAYAQQQRLALDNDISEQMINAKVNYVQDQNKIEQDTKNIIQLRDAVQTKADDFINPKQNAIRAINDLKEPRFKDYEYVGFLNYHDISAKEERLQNGYQLISKGVSYPFIELGLQASKTYDGLRNWTQPGISGDVLHNEQDKLQKQIISSGFFANDNPAFRKKLSDLETGQTHSGTLAEMSFAVSELRLRYYLTSTKNEQGVVSEPNLAMLYRACAVQEELEQEFPDNWQQGLAAADDTLSNNGYAKEVTTSKLMQHDFFKMLDEQSPNGELNSWTLIPRQIAQYPNSGRLMQTPLYLDPYQRERQFYQATGKLMIKDPRNPKMQQQMWQALSNYFGDLAQKRSDLLDYQKLKGYHDEILNPDCDYTTYLQRWDNMHHGNPQDYAQFHPTENAKAPEFATFSKIDDTSIVQENTKAKDFKQNG